ncbi:hypothetical protein FQN54_005912 [Arachnomyces sp. PD_36]|nr:hypothetical protein FQN54_005912 [Arachnomyces sp. PD_36]
MATDLDDDYFSDDGFDTLPPSTLLQLEQNAFQATQRQQELANPNRRQAPKPQLNQQTGLQQRNNDVVSGGPVLQQPAVINLASSDYGDLDVGVLDAGVLDNGEDPTPFEETKRIGHANSNPARPRPPERNGYAIGGHGRRATGMVMDTDSGVMPGGDGSATDFEGLKAQLERLTRDNKRMLQELEDAKSNAESRAGEIAIIRANQAKLTKNHDSQIAALRKAMEEEVRKHRAEFEASREESKRAQTENAFLKQDLVEETNRLHGMRLKAKNKLEDKSAPTTPKKSKALPLRDGFDDDEVAMLSPSKSSGGRAKRGTPHGPGKRKRRTTQDSPIPVPALQLSESHEVNADDAPLNQGPPDAKKAPSRGRGGDENLQFMKRILNHRTYPNEERDLEIFTKFSFPSEPNRMFSSIVLEAASSLKSENYPLEFARVIISLWSRSLEEKFYKPIYLFMAIIKSILLLQSQYIAADIIADLVPVLQDSACVNGVPRFKHSPMSHLSLGQFKQTPRKELHYEVSATECLNLLYLTATGCLRRDDALRHFWRTIRYDFTLMMLNPFQPISDIIINLHLLSTSILQTTFGPILNTEHEQSLNESYIIDRVANLLSETPRVDEGMEPCTTLQICKLRLEALSFLRQVAFSATDPANDRGGMAIASHPSALARLIRSMHDELDSLYSHTPEHELHATLVNGLTNLVYGLLRNHGDHIDLRSKLLTVAGGTQKYLVVLTRLAFSDGPLLEAGIEDDTVEMAHEMLEEAVNPQEAEALLEIFPSARRDE